MISKREIFEPLKLYYNFAWSSCRSSFTFRFSLSNFIGFEYQNTTICHFGTCNFCDATYDICPLNHLAGRIPRQISTIEFERFNIVNFIVIELFSDFAFRMLSISTFWKNMENLEFSQEFLLKRSRNFYGILLREFVKKKFSLRQFCSHIKQR